MNLQRRRVKSGAKAEEVAERALKSAGFVCIEKIETGWTVQWRDGRVVSAFPKKKVCGDFWAVERGTGRAVRVEVKSTQSETLSLSALGTHQQESLDNIVAAGGVGLLIWVRGYECIAYKWPIKDFKKGSPLKWPTVFNKAATIGEGGADGRP